MAMAFTLFIALLALNVPSAYSPELFVLLVICFQTALKDINEK